MDVQRHPKFRLFRPIILRHELVLVDPYELNFNLGNKIPISFCDLQGICPAFAELLVWRNEIITYETKDNMKH